MTVTPVTGQLYEDEPLPETVWENKTYTEHKTKICWRNLFILSYFHLASLYGIYLVFTDMKLPTLLFVVVLFLVSKIGVTAGVHRLWSHRSYKANFPLRLILMLLFTLAFEGYIYAWARDHRVHHKYQETDADPYNAGKGFWFSHMGWLIQTKHPAVMEKGRCIDISDLKKDKLVMFQRKYYWPIVYVICLIIPTVVPVCCWNESWMTAWHVAVCLRYVISYHTTALINSVAHLYGNRPYDMTFFARENSSVSIVTLGEGWHNYHHTFPWDYKASELGSYGFNLTNAFIDFFAKTGWAYNLKTVPPALVRKRAMRTGDGSHLIFGVGMTRTSQLKTRKKQQL